MKTHTLIDSPVGALTLVASDGVLGGVYFHDDRRTPNSLGRRSEPEFAEYFAGRRRAFTVPARPEGTEFQRTVRRALTAIPYGETWSYARLAGAVGVQGWERIRAVAAAVGANPLAIVIPCHRVIGSNGALVGFSGGLERKRYLLDLESAEQPLFMVAG